jgi:hypothetical protein
MRKSFSGALIAVGVLALVGAGLASALTLHAGNLIVEGDGTFFPKALPKDHVAPIRVSMHGRVRTVDGSRPSPVREIVLEVDRHSLVETRGLPFCTRAKLIATNTKQARRNCPDAIIGTGFGTGVVELPEQQPVEESSAITIFNGPSKDGNPTAFGHAHINYPAPTTIIAPAEVQKIDAGRYGYRIIVHFPKLINDYGSPTYGRITINRKWRYRGQMLSIANASCADGRLQARVQASFADGTHLAGTAFKRCRVRKE